MCGELCVLVWVSACGNSVCVGGDCVCAGCVAGAVAVGHLWPRGAGRAAPAGNSASHVKRAPLRSLPPFFLAPAAAVAAVAVDASTAPMRASSSPPSLFSTSYPISLSFHHHPPQSLPTGTSTRSGSRSSAPACSTGSARSSAAPTTRSCRSSSRRSRRASGCATTCPSGSRSRRGDEPCGDLI